ncbi:hypothetical protein ITJ64_05090 [Herbiconiux sp. VKM Ac-1786]|uniref:hypothetical protein n=1 Tax=Herbiconiux sp. VKM Ac-1786 TaxID=2783824 RepID=UPI00188A4465|nr:hypothetical protein [Herbiconiux sp. VKM Ac-1786]MBF4571885.1 hypothetical protein [Herbiconiux sp. VKM Ac-1786]
MPHPDFARTIPGLPAPLCTTNAVWGLEYRDHSIQRTALRRGGIAVFPPGTSSREAARLINYYWWIDFIGIRAFAIALPLLLVTIHTSLTIAPILTIAIGVAIDTAAFMGVALVLRCGLPSSKLVRFLTFDPAGRGLQVLARDLSKAREPGTDAVQDEVLWASAWEAALEQPSRPTG